MISCNVEYLYNKIRACTICKDHLPLEPNPIFSFSSKSKIVLLSQAPGIRAHKSKIPYKDSSGLVLRDWLGVSEAQFYNRDNFAILPIGFCYPGKGKTGDLPPRPECKPKWHDQIWNEMNNVQFIVTIGRYAQRQYLINSKYPNLTETVKNYKDFLPNYFPIPHPSPLNRRWLKINPWFENDIKTHLKYIVKNILN